MKVNNWDTRSADSCKLSELMGTDYCNDCRSYAYCKEWHGGRFMKQMTIFDIIPENTRNIPCGYTDDMSLIGRELRFDELKNLIGKKCIICSPRQSAFPHCSHGRSRTTAPCRPVPPSPRMKARSGSPRWNTPVKDIRRSTRSTQLARPPQESPPFPSQIHPPRPTRKTNTPPSPRNNPPFSSFSSPFCFLMV